MPSCIVEVWFHASLHGIELTNSRYPALGQRLRDDKQVDVGIRAHGAAPDRSIDEEGNRAIAIELDALIL